MPVVQVESEMHRGTKFRILAQRAAAWVPALSKFANGGGEACELVRARAGGHTIRAEHTRDCISGRHFGIRDEL